MSRREVENASYMIAFGADRATSAFIQVWAQPHMDMDHPLVVVDNRGVVVMDERGLAKTPPALRMELAEVRKRFQIARGQGNLHPNVDAETLCRIAKSVGFPDVDTLIYKTVDEF